MSFNLDAVRAQFPALAIKDNGVRRIYLDNPAGTQVPVGVADAMSDCLLSTNANLGGYFRTSQAAGVIISSARDAMADLLNAPSSDEIVFGQNMTTITMHISRSIGRLLRPGDEIILSRMDHDANVWPWAMLAKDLDLKVTWLPFNIDTFEFDLEVLDNLITERTRLLCVGGASNLTGTLNDVTTICAKARAAGAVISWFAPPTSFSVRTRAYFGEGANCSRSWSLTRSGPQHRPYLSVSKPARRAMKALRESRLRSITSPG
jgi:selenocysteine lyase/cysteine desulfurase